MTIKKYNSFAIHNIPMESPCCCKALHFGKCYDFNDTIIATCVDAYNATAVTCQAYPNATDDFQCLVGTDQDWCPSIKVKAPLYPSSIFFMFAGVLVSLNICAMICSNSARRTTFVNACEKIKCCSVSDDDRFDEGAPTPIAVLESDSEETAKTVTSLGSIAASMVYKVSSQWEEQGTDNAILLEISNRIGTQSIILGCIIINYQLTIQIALYVQLASLVFFSALVFASYPQEQEFKDDTSQEKSGITLDLQCVDDNEQKGGDNANEEQDCKAQTTSDIYKNLSMSIFRVCFTFVCQVLLLAIYTDNIYKGSVPDFTSNMSYLYFIVGALVQNAISYGRGEDPISDINKRVRFWSHVLRRSVKGEGKQFLIEVPRKKDKKISNFEIRSRMLMETIVNISGTSIIFFLLPLHLATVQEATQFVLDVVAVHFITQIDNLDEKKEITLINMSTYESNRSKRDVIKMNRKSYRR